ncbi:pyruvate, phosphate dikinase [Paenibacillus albiflavus]|uniref:Pyruvate, phosphate dikinase n=1 Tax=Paenibacillus albiflavus TaxID=2545760 RepID=A0A4R4EDR3_9BACL|nr:pyruvate, phosphate dikinase [Paenibacillus albiflavus]TCZ77180.1 pyruvate, phosphate dikinase [Paenibacillus albiflavus]
MQKRVVHFEDGNQEMKWLLGGKGANLAEMTRAGLPVPPGYTITTEACRQYLDKGELPDGLLDEIISAMQELERKKGQQFGDPSNPLLVSVRSGSVNSMPGMMDTILNLGLNDANVHGLAQITNNERFAYDCYRRLIQMFGNVVCNVESYHFERLLLEQKKAKGVELDQDLTADDLKQLIIEYQDVFERMAKQPFPQDVKEQLRLAVEAVFRSWNNQRAIIYRRINQIPDDQGTAVNIQSMVFGNLGLDSGTGVLFTRNPATGEDHLYGEFLTNAQGEDVVAGIRTPRTISELNDEMPEIYRALHTMAKKLEAHYQDVQDIEFTIEKGQLYMLQTRNAKRTAQAAVKTAVDLVKEGVITREEAIMRLDESHLNQLMHPTIDTTEPLTQIALGLPASPGAASGQVVFDADTAELWASKQNGKVILVRTETTPEDIHGVFATQGILTSRGGMTSHAAVVARGMGKPCVCGCESILVDENQKVMRIGEQEVKEGDWISIDGATGKVYAGKVVVKDATFSSELTELISWADKIRRLKVFANADYPQDAAKARELGAEGIGLCRTEHMFFGADRLPVVQAMILADDQAARDEALKQLLPMQQADFEGIFEAMDGLPVTIRLLDPPLHEFLPHMDELDAEYAELVGAGQELSREAARIRMVMKKVRALQETNPMLGQRGCRLGILFPEIYDMQIKAIFFAVKNSLAKSIKVIPQIMIPLVGHVNELKFFRERIDRIAEQILGEATEQSRYVIGTMIEVPRAALTADQIVPYADFFSFGTNDLTQMTFGYSRDDAEGKFLSHYVEHKLLPNNPFQVLDRDGVGQLIEMAVNKAKTHKPNMKSGVCGEHGGDKESIIYCHQIGLDYVSCSPYRVPLARIAAAQAKILEG